MARTSRPLLALLGLLTLASPRAQAAPGAPTKYRPPMQIDFDRCAFAAEELGNRSLAGRVQLELLVRKSGNVYAAFVHDERQGIDDRRFMRCLTAIAPRWVFAPVAVDHQRAYVVAFIHSGDAVSTNMHNGEGLVGAGRASAFLPDLSDVPPTTPLDAKVAQGTLEIAEFATQAERAVAQLAAGDFDAAIASARVALAADPSDPIALRALSQSLVEAGGDLVEARLHAERLAALQPRSVVGREALIRVCLAQRDDRCAVSEFERARAAIDLVPRSRLVAELHGSTQAAAFRLARKERTADPCANERSETALALCVVKRCLDAGSAIYARELAGRATVPYEAGDWRAQSLSEGRVLVTRPIEPVAERVSASSWELERHDARWIVEIGRQLVVLPQNFDARAITARHSYCAPRRVLTQTGR